MNEFTHWFNANKLSVNKTTIKSMLISSSRYCEKHIPVDICVPCSSNSRDRQVEQATTYKYLGVHLDSHLTFSDHEAKLCKKEKSRTYILLRMRNFISDNLAAQVYSSLIDPYLT